MGFEFLANTLQAREAASLRRIRQPVISSKHGMIEIQGDHREILKVELEKRGLITKLAGG